MIESGTPSGPRRPRLRMLLPDLAPWRSSRDFRLLWCSGLVTNFGSFMALVSLPLQIKRAALLVYRLTR